MQVEERERDRYPRATIAEQMVDRIEEFAAHRGAVALLLVLLAGGLFMLLTRPDVVRISELQAGNCLWIHAIDGDPGNPDGRPAGTPLGVVAALYATGAERAGCDASHSHEVIEVFTIEGDRSGTDWTRTVGDRTAACEAKFRVWAGGAELPGLALVVAVPDQSAWAAGVRTGACLVGRADGQFLSRPALEFGRPLDDEALWRLRAA